jgi:hypothetical protein
MASRRIQTVQQIDPHDVPVGAVGMTLASHRPGILTAEAEQDVALQDRLSRDEQTQAFLATARKRWRQSADCEAELRRDMLDDLRFYNADQWPDNIKLDRVLDGRQPAPPVCATSHESGAPAAAGDSIQPDR